MNFFQIVWRSLRQHALSSLAAVVSLALGVALLTAVVGLRLQTHEQFTRVGLGVDAVLAPKGSPLQITLNAIYHLEEMPGKIPWALLDELRREPAVAMVVPFCTGHSFAGVRVNAIDRSFLTDFEIEPGRLLSFDPALGGAGRPFASGPAKEAVAGWEAAQRLGITLGSSFNPVCGVNLGDPVHQNDHLTFVGILARTGTPHDRAIYIPLDTFYTLGGHGDAVARMATDYASREVSGALVRMRRIRQGVMHPGVRDLKFMLAQNPVAQLVVPAEVLPGLFNIIGWVDHVLVAIAIVVVLLASLFLVVSLLNALRERRRDHALLRCLGAGRRTILGLILAESTIISMTGGILGILLGQILLHRAAILIQAESGVMLPGFRPGLPDLVIFGALLVLGLLTGLWPAFRAYRAGVLEHLRPSTL